MKIKLSHEKSCLIALSCATKQNLGNICRCFYDEFLTPKRCSYAVQYQSPRQQILLEQTRKMLTPRPCRIYAVNGGFPLPADLQQDNISIEHTYCYDFAIVGECGNVNECLDAFLKQMRLQELESSSLMSKDEMHSLIKQWGEVN